MREAGDGAKRSIPAANVPDVILLDWNMPNMSGMTSCARSAGLAVRPKVVFCTTENGMAYIRAAIEAGADEYVMKPFDKEIVEAKFQEVGLI